MKPPLSPNLVGLTGRAGSGKSTLAKSLKERHFHLRSYGSVLKEMLSVMGFPTRALYGTPEEKLAVVPELGVSGRHAMQTLGTEWGRVCVGPDVWVNALFMNRPVNERTVIDDVRFPNEAEGIHNRGGIVIGIRRGTTRFTEGAHVSENYIEDLPVDHWIENNGTVEEAIGQLESILDSYATQGIDLELETAA